MSVCVQVRIQCTVFYLSYCISCTCSSNHIMYKLKDKPPFDSSDPPTNQKSDSEIQPPLNPPSRTIVRITREESNRRFNPDTTVAFFKYARNHIKHIHQTLKHDAYYWQDDTKDQYSVYHFASAETASDFYNSFDKNKVSENLIIRPGREIDTHNPTTDYSTWTTIGPKKNVKPTSESTKHNSQADNTTANDQAEEQSPENLIKIHSHSSKPGNPLHLKSLSNKYKLTLPTKQFYSHKFTITTLQFPDKKAAVNFIDKIPIIEYGPKATYELYKPAKKPPTPTNLAQDWNALFRGVDPD